MPIASVTNPIAADSPVITHVGRARHYGETRRGYRPRLIVWHTTESPNATVNSSLAYSARREDQVSTTVFAGEQGLGQDVPELGRPYTQARWNDEALALEVIGRAAWSDTYWQESRAATLANIVTMTADWCRRWSIPPRWLTAAEILAGAAGVADHRLCNDAAILEVPSRRGNNPYTHTDIGPGLRILAPVLLARVAAQLNPPTPNPEDEMPRILILTDAGGAAILLTGITGRWLDPGRYDAFHWHYPSIVDEPAARSWLANVVISGPLPPGVERSDVWGHQPDA